MKQNKQMLDLLDIEQANEAERDRILDSIN